MTPEQALTLLDEARALARLTLNEQTQVQEAVNTLKEFIEKDKPASISP